MGSLVQFVCDFLELLSLNCQKLFSFCNFMPIAAYIEVVLTVQNFKKRTFLDNLRTATQQGNMVARQMTSFFSSTFSVLTVCNIHFCIWKQPRFIFMCSAPLWSILVCKKHQFWAKATIIRTAHHTFLKTRHPEVNKNPYYILSPEGSQKKL